MKCEICHINQAARSVKRNIEGDEKEFFVCDSCARTSPHAGSVPTSLTDVLFSLGMQVGGQDKIEDSVCPACGISRSEIREKHRLGCPKCYDTFVTDIRTFLSAQQPVMPSSGKGAEGGFERGSIDKLKEALEKAVAEERYEDAAEIVEKIRHSGVKMESDDEHGKN